MKKVVLYTRVSTEEQKDSGFSLPDQKKRLLDFAKRNGYDVIGHYEEDHSAKTFNRPAWNQFKEELRQGTIQPSLILVIRPDRLQRNFESLIEELRFLSRYGVGVKTLEQDIEINTPEDRLVWSILNMLPQVDNERRSLNTKRGMRQAKREGRWNGVAPTGYSLDRINGVCSIIPNHMAKYVTKSFQLFSKGIYSKEEVRRMMSDKGFKLSKNAFSTMLSNPVYVGKIRIKAWKDEPEEVVNGLHESIVTIDTFEKVQRIVNQKRIQPLQKTTKNPNLPLRGYLVCHKCGGNLTGSKSKGNGGTYFYYHCQKGCNVRFRATEANSIFVDYLNSFALPEEIQQLYMAVMKDTFKDEDKRLLKEYSELERLINQASERINSVHEKFIDNSIDEATYKNLKEKYQDQKSELIMKQTRLRGRKTNFQKYMSYCVPLIRNIGSHFRDASIEVKQKIIGSIFPEKLVFEDEIYRTTKPSMFLSLFTLNINDLGEIKKDVKEILSITSSKAPPQGLEPWTYGLTVRRSNQLS